MHSLLVVHRQLVQELEQDFQRYMVQALYESSGYLGGDNYDLWLLALSVKAQFYQVLVGMKVLILPPL